MNTMSEGPEQASSTAASMREALLFRELLYVAQQALMTRLSGEECPDASNLLMHLFGAGHACGLNDKEVVQALLKPAKAHLRPELPQS